jgi:argininosuccinate synthase
MATRTVVLAYSGGLDTSCILRWLLDRDYEVVAYVANIGQRDDFERVRQKALSVGAREVHILDLRREFVTQFIYPALGANALYEGRYLLGTALARPLIARGQVQVARRVRTHLVAHGATGKGNDQVRFELAYNALDPSVEVIAPWRDPEFLARFRGRKDLLAYAEQHGIPVSATVSKPYSEDENLMHISHEAGILEDPGRQPPESVVSWIAHPTQAPDRPRRIALEFKDGIPVRLQDLDEQSEWTDPLELFEAANRLGAENGVGLVDMVENRFVGIKSRGIYETPGATILRVAHQDLEGMAMDREVMRLRDMLAAKFSELVYYGFWYSPEMDFLMAAIRKSQEVIDGTVSMTLYKGNVLVDGRTSPSSLYDPELSSMDIEGGFRQQDSTGFIRIHALRLRAHSAILARTGQSPYLPPGG